MSKTGNSLFFILLVLLSSLDSYCDLLGYSVVRKGVDGAGALAFGSDLAAGAYCCDLLVCGFVTHSL